MAPLFKRETCRAISNYFSKANDIFFKFISSQVIDAIIVGILVSIASILLIALIVILLNIENLLKAKGFSEALAVISDDSVDIVVRSEGLLASETLQIQEIAVKQSGASLADIKIIPVK